MGKGKSKSLKSNESEIEKLKKKLREYEDGEWEDDKNELASVETMLEYRVYGCQNCHFKTTGEHWKESNNGCPKCGSRAMYPLGRRNIDFGYIMSFINEKKLHYRKTK